jgi:flagellar M-ring protein FliF
MPALLQTMSLKGKITLGAVAAGTLLALFVLFQVASRPSWQTLQAGVDPATASKVTAALGAKGIPFELQDGGTSIAVHAEQAAQSRMALADSGLSAGGSAQQPGFESLDEQKLGSSSFQQQVAYQRALEGEIARTVAQISGVGSAQVRLTMPKEELFTDEEKSASAAVLLGSCDVDGDAVKGIANLVASSVPNLDAKGVTITDATGRMLWPAGDGVGGGSSKAAAEARYAQQLTASVDAMLARTLGPDKAQVRITADLNVDQQTEEQLTYANRGTPLSSTEERETLESTGAAGGTAGTAANVAGVAAAGNGVASDYRKSSTKTEFGVNKTVTRTTRAPGAVNRLSVAVLADEKALSAGQVAALRTAVSAAVGAQAGRDTVQITRVPFAAAPKVEPPSSPIPAIPPMALSAGKVVGAAFAALLFLFFVTRHLRRREGAALAEEPSWLRELHAPARPELAMAGVGVGVAGGDDGPVSIPSMIDFEDPRKVAVEELVEREPERVAAQLRSWITADGA